jgi:hypothetical protein
MTLMLIIIVIDFIIRVEVKAAGLTVILTSVKVSTTVVTVADMLFLVTVGTGLPVFAWSERGRLSCCAEGRGSICSQRG